MEELKPCPFCGGEAVRKCIFPNRYFFVECKNCHVSLPFKGTKEEAIEAWNRRVNRCQDCLIDNMIDDGR